MGVGGGKGMSEMKDSVEAVERGCGSVWSVPPWVTAVLILESASYKEKEFSL